MEDGGNLDIDYLPVVSGLTIGGGGTMTFSGTFTTGQSLSFADANVAFNGNYNIAFPLTLNNSTLTLDGNWTNTSSITVSNTTVYLGGNFTISNLGNFNATNCTVYLTGTLSNSSTSLKLSGQSWILDGGDVVGGTVQTTNGASLIAENNGTLDGVTFDGTLNVGNSINGGWLQILDGLTLNGTMLVGNPTNGWYGYVNFPETESLLGNATVKFGNSGTCNALRLTSGGTTLTLGPTVLVEGISGQVGSSYYYCFGGPQNVSLINQGTIAANGSGGTIYVQGAPVVNSGSMSMNNGGSLDINYLPDVTGLSVGSGGTLTLNGNYNINQTLALNNTTLTLNGNWTNGASIDVSNTTVTLGGSFTVSNLGTFNPTNSTVYLTGVLDNTNTTLKLNSSTWILYQGDVQGGIIEASNGASLVAQSSGTLDGVTFNGTLDVGNTINSAWLNVLDGLTLNGTMLVGNPTNGWNGYVNFPETESLTGNATVKFGNSGTCNALRLTTGATTLTLGPDVLIEGDNGQVGSSYYYCFGGPLNVGLINQGAISANVSGGTIYLIGSPVVNSGSIGMSNGGNLSVNYMPDVTGVATNSSGVLTLNGSYDISSPLALDNSTLTLGGSWTNVATITLSNSTVTLSGNLTVSNLGTFKPTNSTVYLAGNLDNTNTTLTLDGQSWILNGGTIAGGTVDTVNGASLIADANGTLNGITLNGTLDVGNSINGGWLNVLDGLTLNGTALVGNPTNGWYGYINFEDTESLTGTATVQFGDSGNCNAMRMTTASTTLTLGPEVTVVGGYGQIGGAPYCLGSPSTVNVVNQGTIMSTVAGDYINISAQAFTNTGTLTATAGTINVNPNYSGTINVLSGTANFGINALNNYGQLNISGAAQLSGLNAHFMLEGGYVPLLGNSFTLVNYGSDASPFASVSYPSPSDGLFWQFTYGSTSASLVVTNAVVPVISITNPVNNSIFPVGGNITINTVVTDSNAAIAKVQFYQGTTEVGQSLSSPFSLVWSNVPFGDYVLTAVATDTTGAAGTSAPVNISVYLGASGTNFIWTGATSSDWFTAANWSPAGIPGAPDTATITNGGTVTLGNNTAVASVDLASGTINGAGMLTVSNAFLWTGGTLGCPVNIPSGASLNLLGGNNKYIENALTSQGVVTWGGGNLYVYNDGVSYFGQIENQAGGNWNVTCDQSINTGYAGPGWIFSNAGTFTKQASANTTTFYLPFLNSGTVIVEQGTVNFNDGGTLQGVFTAQTGTDIEFSGGTFSNTLPAVVSGAGLVQFNGGNLYLYNAAISNLQTLAGNLYLGAGFEGGFITNLTVSGSTLNGTNSVTGTFNWNGGTVNGPLTVAGAGTLNIGSGQDKYLLNVLTNQGLVNWSGNNIHVYNDGVNYFGQIQNLVGATWEMNCDQYINTGYGGPGWIFNNAGSFTKVAGTGNTVLYLPFLNSGTATAEEGSIYFEDGGIVNGTFTAQAGADLYFDGGSFSNTVTSVVNGPGNVEFIGGSFYLENNYNSNLQMVGGNVFLGSGFESGEIKNLTINGSTLNGTNLVTGTFNWNGGSVNGPLTIASNGTLNLGPGQDKYVLNLLVNQGLVNWSGNNIHVYNDGSTMFGQIQNAPGGVWDVTCDQYINTGYSGPGWIFNNAGTFTKLASVNNTTLYLPFFNTGTISAVQGSIYLEDGGTAEGAFTTQTGANVYLSSGTFSNALASVVNGSGYTAFTGGTLELLKDEIAGMALTGGTIELGSNFQGGTITNLTFDGSTLAGTNTVTGVLNWDGGDVAGPLTVANGGTLNLGQGQDKYLLNVLTNLGLVVWSGANNFHIYNYAPYGYYGQIENMAGAIWNIQCDQSMYNDYNTPAASFNNAGSFTKQANGNNTVLYNPFVNTGLVTAEEGSIYFEGGGPIQGAYTASAGANIYFYSGVFTDGTGALFTGPGNVEFLSGTLNLFNNGLPGLTVTGGTIMLKPTFQGGTITNFTFSGGTLSSTNTVTGVLNWDGGYLGAPLTVASGATLNIGGSNDKYLENVLTNLGTVIWTGSGNIHAYNYAPYSYYGAVQNMPGAVFSAQNDQNYYNDYGAANVNFNNAGTFIKQNSVNTTYVYGIFQNSGVLKSQDGVIYFNSNGSYVQTGATQDIVISDVNTVGHLTFGGNVNIDGTLEVDLADGYTPFTGEQFSIINFGSYAGGFENFAFPALAAGQGWQVWYTPTTVSLTVAGQASPPIKSRARCETRPDR